MGTWTKVLPTLFEQLLPVLYFYSLISPQEYQSRVVNFYKNQSELPTSAFQNDGFEDIPLVDFSKK
ncbi:hypothetical protein [Endozoicomonas atrinae]|uniref:hypothetical protein n=1 Tax=Endozoicomonas atrinae TaxID=1333660 RepID=UPI003B004B82